MFDGVFIIRKLNEFHAPAIVAIVEELEYWFLKYKVPVIYKSNEITPSTLFVSVGGDGTMLYTMKLALATNSPVLGIAAGNLGFLTDFDKVSLRSTVKAVLNGAVTLEPRMILTAQLDDKEFIAVNEFVVSNLYSDNMLKYELIIGGRSAGTHTANSVITASPTGSTAYALSAGGAIIEPSMQALEIIPVAPVTMTSRPIITGADEVVIKVNPWPHTTISLKADGQEVMQANGETPTVLTVRKSGTVDIMHTQDWNFYTTLSNKLGWNKK